MHGFDLVETKIIQGERIKLGRLGMLLDSILVGETHTKAFEPHSQGD